MVIATPLTHPQSPTAQEGGRLVSTSGRTLPLERSEITAEGGGGLARTILTQHFKNPHPEALRVSYKLPLPADGAVGGFSFQIGEELVEGEVDRKHAARERFERAILQGQTAAIVEEERSSLFTQEVGNIPPGETVICRIVIDHPLRWLSEGAWEYRFPTVVGARYMGSAAQTPDAKKIAVDVSEERMAARLSLSLAITDQISNPNKLESPSHGVELVSEAEKSRVVFRRGAPVRLDRDVVVRWPVAKLEVGIRLGVMRLANDGKDEGFGLLTLVPPSPEARARPVARDLIFLIDTSGSMDGQPLAQATSIASAMVDTLHDDDQIELIEFSSAPRPYKSAPVRATESNKKDVIRWLRSLRASGSTEMESAIKRAIDPLRRGAQRQVVLITDGYIGFEERIVKYVLDELPRSCRVHTVGVGSAVNRTLTQGVARAGGGVEVVLGVDEDAERPAARLLSRTADPQVIELDVRGPGVTQVVPVRLPDLYAGCPALIPVRLDAQGGEVVVRGRSADGSFEARVAFDPLTKGEGNGAFAKLFAREWVSDLEAYRMVANRPEDTDEQIESVGLEFQIATRKTSWVAVSRERRVGDDVGQRTEEMPQEIPHGVSIAGFGLRSVGSTPAGALMKTRSGVSTAAFGRPSPKPAAPSRRMKLEQREAPPPAELEELSSISLEDADDEFDASTTGESLDAISELPFAEQERPTEPPAPPASAPLALGRMEVPKDKSEKARVEVTQLAAPKPKGAFAVEPPPGLPPAKRPGRRLALLLLLLAVAAVLAWLLFRGFSVPTSSEGQSGGAKPPSAPRVLPEGNGER